MPSMRQSKQIYISDLGEDGKPRDKGKCPKCQRWVIRLLVHMRQCGKKRGKYD